MVEGVMVALFFVVVFVCLIGISGLYRTKLVVMQDARYQNVLNATNDCTPAGRAYAAQRPPAPDDTPSVPEELGQFGIDFSRLVLEGGGVSRASTTRRYGYGSPAQRIAGQVTSSSYTTCNEKNLGLNLAELVVDSFQKSWDFFAKDIVAGIFGG